MKNSIEKTKKYNHLDLEERIKIEAYLNTNKNISTIAVLLNRNKATISREIRRNRNEKEKIYKSDFAENKKYKRKKKACKKQRLKDRRTRKLVATLIQERHSPRTVCSILEDEYNIKINYESVYQWIYKKRQDLIEFLAQKHRKRLKRAHKKQPRGFLIKNKKDISEREETVNNRERFGDFEVDLIVSSKSLFCILVIIERKSRYCILRLLPNKQALTVATDLLKELKRFPKGFVKTITYDNGSENAYHETIDKRLGVQSYFCKPYHSWEKGSVENLNKLVRRFLPKGTDFALTKNEHLYNIQNKLNMIPRKSNCFKSAAKVINVALLH